MQYTTEAILLAVRNWGEADKMVTFLAKDKGKVTAIAYGCRRPRSRLAGGMQSFNHLELNVMGGSRVDTIKDCQVLTPFKALREDLERMAYASFVAEIVAEFCPDNYPEPDIFELSLLSFAAMEQRNPRLTALISACKLLDCAGYQPVYDSCVLCGGELEKESFFSLAHSGCCCQKCHGADELAFDEVMYEFIHNMRCFNFQKPQTFKVSGAVLVKTEQLLLSYLQYVLEKPLKSLDFIAQLAAVDKVAAKH